MTLDALIQQMVTLGEKDPFDLADKLMLREEEDALLALVDLRSLIADRARVIIGNDRRKRQHQYRPGNPITRSELKLASFWVPNKDGYTEYKRADQVTVEDFESRAAFHERLAAGNMKQARWCRDLAALMRDAGATTFGAYSGPIPELDGELFELPVAA